LYVSLNLGLVDGYIAVLLSVKKSEKNTKLRVFSFYQLDQH